MLEEILQEFFYNLTHNLPVGRLVFWGVVVILFLTRVYWLAPMLFYGRDPIPASKAELAGPGQSTPEGARRHLSEQAAHLAKLGFVPTEIVKEHNGTPNAMFFQFHRHPGTGDIAAVGVYMAGLEPNPKSKTLSFGARLADGSEIRTMTDSVGLRSAPRERERRIVFWMGDGIKYNATRDDLLRVYRCHRALVKRSKAAQRPIPIDDPVAFQLKVGAEFRRKSIESGWYRDIGKATLKVTVLGACMSMWKQAWPWRSLRRASERRMVEKLLAEWGDDPESGTLAA